MAGNEDPSIARNLGAFFGHIVKAIKSDPNAQQRVEVQRKSAEEQKDDGVILRRTTIDEVVLPPETEPPNNAHRT